MGLSQWRSKLTDMKNKCCRYNWLRQLFFLKGGSEPAPPPEWQAISTSIYNPGVQGVRGIAANNGTWISAENASPFVRRSSDAGASFTTVSLPSLVFDPAVIYANGVWMVHSRFAPPDCYRSIDDGLTWTQVNSTGSPFNEMVYCGLNRWVAIDGNASSAFLSNDNGATWSAPVAIAADRAVTGLSYNPTTGRTVYITQAETGTRGEYSDDFGQTWNPLVGFPFTFWTRLAVNPLNNTWVAVGGEQGGVNCAVSNDGINFSPSEIVAPGADFFDIFYGNGQFRIVQGSVIAAYRSSNGVDWTFEDPLINTATSQITYDEPLNTWWAVSRQTVNGAKSSKLIL
jgi:hypothetical protein